MCSKRLEDLVCALNICSLMCALNVCSLAGQVPSHKLPGGFSEYVCAVPFPPSVCCPEDRQVNTARTEVLAF